MLFPLLLTIVLFRLSLALDAPTHRYFEKEVRIPWIQANPEGLMALLVYADTPGKHPLVVMTHGTSREPEPRREVTPWSMLPQATWFAQRGWMVMAVVRRGYGASGGKPDFSLGHRCPQTNYSEEAEHSADDLRTAINFGKKLDDVDPTRIISIGVSTGGLASVALTARPPEGLVAGINFAGGRGSQADHDVCNPKDLIATFRSFGKHSRTPMLWIYADNDKYFWPELAQQFDQAFRAAGGQDQFVRAPAFGSDGHSLFRAGISVWSPIVDEFLKAQNLTVLKEPLDPPALPNVPFPAGLDERGQRAFESYLRLGPHKAFAMSSHTYGLSTAQMNKADAQRKALENCKHSLQPGDQCAVVSADNSDPVH